MDRRCADPLAAGPPGRDLAACPSSCRGCPELRLDDLAVLRARPHELVVRSASHHASLVQYDDVIGVQDRTDALGDDKNGRVAGLGFERYTQPRVRSGI